MIKNLYGVPNLKQAKAILEESACLNPGLWVEHSIYVGKCAALIAEHEFAAKYIHNLEYNDYDKLIQLCDALALPEGYCLLEKRMMDVALRHGVNEYTVPKWKEVFKIQKYFEDKIGQSIYSVLPGVVENTFGIGKQS